MFTKGLFKEEFVRLAYDYKLLKLIEHEFYEKFVNMYTTKAMIQVQSLEDKS